MAQKPRRGICRVTRTLLNTRIRCRPSMANTQLAQGHRITFVRARYRGEGALPTIEK